MFEQVVSETIWPTRCAICDKNSYLLCPNCTSKLPFIDNNLSCQVCGEPFGSIQCCGCAPIDKSLTEEEKIHYKPEFEQAISVFMLNKDTGRIVALNKDAGERRLSEVMAYFMSKAIPSSWITNNTYLTYIPASKEAITRRGFDHCASIAKAIEARSTIQCISCFDRPSSKDQRTLSRSARKSNLANTFRVKEKLQTFITKTACNFIIIDDVYTTGATLNAASKALKESGASKIYCLTFARTF